MKFQLITLFVLLGTILSGQTKTEFTVYDKPGKIYVEVLVQLNETENIFSSEDYCIAGTSASFCLRNYIQERLDLSINDGESLDFTIESSFSNTKIFQIILSSDTGSNNLKSIEIENNAFVDELSNHENHMKVKLGDQSTEQILLADKRTLKISL